MSKPKHRGLSTYRLADNPEERRFAEAWQEHNDRGRTLDYLLDPHKGERGNPPEAEEPDRVLAATIVQWLGSPVGQGFLRDLGYVNVADALTLLRRRVDHAMNKAETEERMTSNRERELHCGGQASALKAVLAMIDDMRKGKPI